MSQETVIASKYAKAALSLAQEQRQAEQLLEELEWAAGQFGQGDGRRLLLDPRLPVSRKLEAIDAATAGQGSPLLRSLLKLLVEKRRSALLPAIAAGYRQEWLAARKLGVATVTTAIPLSDAQLGQLRAKLSELHGREIELQQVVKTELLAGARVEIGDWLLDGTLEARIDRLRRALLSEN
ncbi:MAG: ATP synthase F1 subunit delta [candidate division FCPU426 bacterium]